MANLYLLQNLEAGYLGNSPMFWAAAGGYTQWIDEAARFTESECNEITGGPHRGRPKWRRWPERVIENAARRTVDMQDLRAGNEVEVSK